MQEKLYPLLFEPLFGAPASAPAPQLLRDFLVRAGQPAPPSDAAECWQLLDSAERQSVVANGPWQGRTLRELVREYAPVLVGRRHPPQDAFPVCARLHATAQWQPLSVHPDRRGPNEANGAELAANNKFWYCVAAADDAQVLAGIVARTTRMQLMSRLNQADMAQVFRIFPARVGDAFFLPVGKLHSLGAGNLVWELSQHPTPPLRLATWQGDDVPADESRQAQAAVRFEDRLLARISQERGNAQINRKIALVPHCPSFHIEELRILDYMFDRTSAASFHLLFAINGTVSIDVEPEPVGLAPGRIALLPAALGDYRVRADAGPAQLLRVSVPHLG